MGRFSRIGESFPLGVLFGLVTFGEVFSMRER